MKPNELTPELKNLFYDYLKDNLRVEINEHYYVYGGYNNDTKLSVTLLLEDTEISSDSIHLSKD